MINEAIFLAYIAVTALAAVGALRAGVTGLTVYIAINSVLMNLMVTKQITLCGLVATPSDALGIGTALGLNLLREYYTPYDAYRALRISCAAMGWYVLVSIFQLAYLPAACDIYHEHYQALLAPMPRILAASLVAYLVTESLEIRLYGLAHRFTSGRWFMVRNWLVTGSTQLVDTLLFTLLGLWGLVDSVSEIIMVSYAIKLATLVSMVPLIALFHRLRHVISF